MTSEEDGLQARFDQLSQQLQRRLEQAQERRERKIESLTPRLRQENIAHFRARAKEYLAKMEEEMRMGRLDLAKIHQDLARSYLDMAEKV